MDGARTRRDGIEVRRLCSTSIHRVWNREIEPALVLNSGEVVELTAPDASDGQITEQMQASDLAALDVTRMNPVAGPVFVRGASPGDVLEIEILDATPGSWGWTGIVPGFGLLADEFPEPWLQISRITGDRVDFGAGIELPCRPFPGTLGVAPDEPGPHSVLPPSRFGGNLDIRHLTAGARLLLPVGVTGGLLSIGDGHAAQGDGEVCGCAIETGMTFTLRLSVRKDIRIEAPQVSLPTGMTSPAEGSAYLTTGVATDLHEAARAAVRAMIDHLCLRYGFAPEHAYALTSVAGDLRIHEIVNAPQWVVGVAIPNAVFAAC
jgi:acetamidase/formamidase